VVSLLFGQEFRLARGHLVALSVGSGFFMLALVCAQGLIALGKHRDTAWGWSIAVLAMISLTAIGDDLLLRVDLGFTGASAIAAGFLGWRLRAALDGSIRSGAKPGQVPPGRDPQKHSG